MNICEFCGKELGSKSSLKSHKIKAKYCLEIQKNKGVSPDIDFYNCKYCNKQFTTIYNKDIHETTVCKNQKYVDELQLLEQKHIDKIQLLDQKHVDEIQLLDQKHITEIKLLKQKHTDKIKSYMAIIKSSEQKHNDEIQLYIDKNHSLTTQLLLSEQENKLMKESMKESIKENISKYEKQIEDYKEQIKEMNTQHIRLIEKFGNKTNNNVKTNITINNKLDLSEEKIKDAIPYYSMEHYERGVAGMADWVYNKLLTNEQGETSYHCTDKARCNFSFMDNNGIVVKDEKAEKLKAAIKPIIAPEIKKFYKAKLDIMGGEDDDDNSLIEKCSSVHKENKEIGGKFEKQLAKKILAKKEKEKKSKDKENHEYER